MTDFASVEHVVSEIRGLDRQARVFVIRCRERWGRLAVVFSLSRYDKAMHRVYRGLTGAEVDFAGVVIEFPNATPDLAAVVLLSRQSFTYSVVTHEIGHATFRLLERLHSMNACGEHNAEEDYCEILGELHEAFADAVA